MGTRLYSQPQAGRHQEGADCCCQCRPVVGVECVVCCSERGARLQTCLNDKQNIILSNSSLQKSR